VLDIVEGSGGASPNSNPTNSRTLSESAARQAIPRSEFDPFELSQHQQSEVHPRCQARPSHRRCVEGLTPLFDILVELVLLQNPIQSFVKRMRRTPRQLLGGDPYRLLAQLPFAFTHGHGRTLPKTFDLVDKKMIAATFTTGC